MTWLTYPGHDWTDRFEWWEQSDMGREGTRHWQAFVAFSNSQRVEGKMPPLDVVMPRWYRHQIEIAEREMQEDGFWDGMARAQHVSAHHSRLMHHLRQPHGQQGDGR